MNKIIGFTVSAHQIDHSDIDVFSAGLKLEHQQVNGWHLYLWGIGNVLDATVNECYTLSFPLTHNLLERNILIEIKKDSIEVKNDWLASIPVFYNQAIGIASTLMQKSEGTRKEVDAEGLVNYLECGYSVYGQTPIKNVLMLRHSSTLLFGVDSKLKVIEGEDLIEGLNEPLAGEQAIFEYLEKAVKQIPDEVLLPVSGGYDSRLLANLVSDPAKVRAYTYGVSPKQTDSFETVHAKLVCEKLNIKWQQIELTGSYSPDYIKQWHQLYSCSTHLHGMYHIEFYNNIRKKYGLNKNMVFLSGILGDVWAGAVDYMPINTLEDMFKLSFSHGMSAKSTECTIKEPTNKAATTFFDAQQRLMSDKQQQVILVGRLKITLLSYLCTIPEYYGLPVASPYLDFKVVQAMTNLPQVRRANRVWQREYFENLGLDVEAQESKKSYKNNLDIQHLEKANLPALNTEILCQYFNDSYIQKINKGLYKKRPIVEEMYRSYRLKQLMLKYNIEHTRLKSLCEYKVIRALEMTLYD